LSGSSYQAKNVGIVAMETYFPKSYVEQTDLEQHDKVSAGKYTVGLGQTAMSFASPAEDINSFALNAVSHLISKNNIDPQSIGRLEVEQKPL